MSTPGRVPYYAAYEERYRSVYAQGVRYWSAFPEELAAVEAAVTAFLERAAPAPAPGAQVIEFGCGEGFVGQVVAGRGFTYTGVDLAPSAVAKARERLAGFGSRAKVLAGDITSLAPLADAGFDAAIDVMCLHMLLVDADREAYLRTAFRLLKPGAPFILCGELTRPDAPDACIGSYEEWLALSGSDYHTPRERDAWHDGQPVKVCLPLLPARERTPAQYESELRAAGFEGFAVIGAFGRSALTMEARKPA